MKTKTTKKLPRRPSAAAKADALATINAELLNEINEKMAVLNALAATFKATMLQLGAMRIIITPESARRAMAFELRAESKGGKFYAELVEKKKTDLA